MKVLNTELTIRELNNKYKVSAKIEINKIDEENDEVKIRIVFKGIEYIGTGTDYLWVDAFTNLQKKLPNDVIICCCMTCKHGNMCPFGNVPRELYCTKNIRIKDKQQLCDLFNTNNKNNILNDKVLSDSFCNDYESQSMNYYTYNDYKLK